MSVRTSRQLVMLLSVALLIEIAASGLALWPFWVNDRGVSVKCGTPAFAIGLDYADGYCRRGGQRRLLAGTETGLLGLMVVPLRIASRTRRTATVLTVKP